MDHNFRSEIDQKAVRIATDLKRNETELIDTLQSVEQYKVYEDFDLALCLLIAPFVWVCQKTEPIRTCEWLEWRKRFRP